MSLLKGEHLNIGCILNFNRIGIGMNEKRLLITGVNSYIGISFKTWLEESDVTYKIDLVSMRNDEWQRINFKLYDSIVHVSALVHQKERKEFEKDYFKVNCENTYRLANLARDAGVKQFIFISSMAIYGEEVADITKDTMPKPTTYYGKSKLLAEEKLDNLRNEKFKVAIIRPPMVYGKNCPGNYLRLAKLAIYSPIFPKFENKRSMIYIDNLCLLMQQILDNEADGVFCPQEENYISTSVLVKEIASTHQHKIVLTSIFNPIIRILIVRVPIFKKIFGDLTYDDSFSKEISFKYQHVNWKESIKQSTL